MKYFFGSTFMSQEELRNIGVTYSIKLDYYKTKEEKIQNEVKYGVEIIKTSYIDDKVDIEKTNIPEFIKDELKIDTILDKLKTNKVTPISAEYVIEDFLKENY